MWHVTKKSLHVWVCQACFGVLKYVKNDKEIVVVQYPQSLASFESLFNSYQIWLFSEADIF